LIISISFFRYLNILCLIHQHFSSKNFSWEISELACLDQTVAYLDRDKSACFRELAFRKKLSFSKKKFFFSTFQLDETKTIESIFVFSIICFSVFTKFFFDIAVYSRSRSRRSRFDDRLDSRLMSRSMSRFLSRSLSETELRRCMTFCIFDVISWLFSAIFIFTCSNWDDWQAMKVLKTCFLLIISSLLFFAFWERSRDLLIFDSWIAKRKLMREIRSRSNLKIIN
jgi:hypothetical protein